MGEPIEPVLCLGEILIDLIAPSGSASLLDAVSLDIHPGGAPANVAVGLGRLGVPVRFCGVVGDDPFGMRLRETLERASVDTSLLRTAANQDTTVALAWKDAAGDGHFRLLRQADRLLDVADVERAGIEHSTAIVIGSVSLAAEPSAQAIGRAVEIAVEADVPVCFDVNVRPSLWTGEDAIRSACMPICDVATLIKLSLTDAQNMGLGSTDPAGIIEAFAQRDGQIVILTDGDRGAWAGMRTAGRPQYLPHVPAFPVEAIDPTGAGDACTAAIISRLIARRWAGIGADDVRFSAAAGALATTSQGAMTSLPSRDEIEGFLLSTADAMLTHQRGTTKAQSC